MRVLKWSIKCFYFLLLDYLFLLVLRLRTQYDLPKKDVYQIELECCTLSESLCVHHFSHTDLNFIKLIGGHKFELGLRGIMKYQDITRFINKNEVDLNKEGLYDFYTYLAEDVKNDFGVFLNDNIALDFNYIEWVSLSSYLIDKMNVGIVGIGCNTNLTQSLFLPRLYAPHIQTYLFSMERVLWNTFRSKMKWYREASNLPPIIGKQILCRVLEQGVTRHCIRTNSRIALVREEEVHIFSANAWNNRSSWPLEYGDFRYLAGKSAFSFKGSKRYNFHVYE